MNGRRSLSFSHFWDSIQSKTDFVTKKVIYDNPDSESVKNSIMNAIIVH